MNRMALSSSVVAEVFQQLAGAHIHRPTRSTFLKILVPRGVLALGVQLASPSRNAPMPNHDWMASAGDLLAAVMAPDP